MKLITNVRTLLAVLLLLASFSVSAHTALKESTPAADATVNVAPTHVDLVFNGPVRLIKFELMGTGHEMPTKFEPSSEAVAEFRIETPGMHPGEFTVNWAVIGADGHTVTNSFGFVVDPTAAEAASD